MTVVTSNPTFPKGGNERAADSESNRVAIIDIGSNTVRMVVFDAPARLPVPIFNERVDCGRYRIRIAFVIDVLFSTLRLLDTSI